jgi:hypothetical protein
MNRRQLEKAIKDHYQPHIESIRVELDFDLNRIEARQPKRRQIPAFPLRFALRSLIVILLASLTYVLFQSNGGTPIQVLAETPDIVAFQAVSSTDLLIQVIAQNDPATLAFSIPNHPPVPQAVQPQSAIENELETLNKYLNMMEQFLGDDQALKVQVSASSVPGYAYQILYQSFSLSGNPVTYTLYYNETRLDASSNLDFAFDDEDDEDVVYWLTGQMTIFNQTYFLEGKRIVDGDEEIYSLRSYVDAQNYVYVRYETDLEDNERKFFYSVINQGITINRSKIKVETEDKKIVTELEFVEGNAKGKYRFVQAAQDNSPYIYVTYEIKDGNTTEKGSIRVEVVIDPITGNTTYLYNVKSEESEEEYQYSRDREDENDEDDDDDEDDEDDDDEEDDEEDEESIE